MAATVERQTFGRRGDPSVDHVLPQMIAYRKSELLPYDLGHNQTSLTDGCATRVTMPWATRENASWYDLWDAVDAIARLCISIGMVGKVSGIGKSSVGSKNSVDS